MSMRVASRELRNQTASLLRRVRAGERIVITSRGEPVASLVPVEPVRRRPLDRDELLRRLQTAQADPGLRDDLARLGQTTDELDSIG